MYLPAHFAPPDYVEGLLEAIVGVELTITRLHPHHGLRPAGNVRTYFPV